MRSARWLLALTLSVCFFTPTVMAQSPRTLLSETRDKVAARPVMGRSAVNQPDDPPGFTRWPQLAALSSSNQSPYYFGASVAIDGDTIVVGAPNGQYAAVFVKPADGWRDMTEVATLLAAPGEACDFGTSVAISGDIIVVGQPQLQFCNTSLGNAYIFVKPADGWKGTIRPVATLTASDGVQFDGLGSSVSIDGNTVVAGATSFYAHLPGAAYVFVEPIGGWSNMTQTAKLTASDGVNEDQFGTGVSVSGTTVIAGAPNAPVGGNNGQGAAYVFVEPANGWTNMNQTAKLIASDLTYSFGTSVAVDGQTAVVGSPNETPCYQEENVSGAAYVFVEPYSGWMNTTQTAKLTRPGEPDCDYLGTSVAIRADRIAAGAPGFSPSLYFGGEGAALVFDKPASGWVNATPNGRGNGSDARGGSRLGSSIALSEHLVVAGADFGCCQRTNGGAYAFVGP